MDLERKKTSWIAPLLVAISVGVLGWVLLSGPRESMAAQQSNFMGGNPSVEGSDEVRTLRLRFPEGSRSNWHSHTEGQLLMVEEGLGRTQVRGESLMEMRPGQPWWTGPEIEHWHGADPDQDVLQLTIYSGSVSWMEPVTDEVYKAPPGN